MEKQELTDQIESLQNELWEKNFLIDELERQIQLMKEEIEAFKEKEKVVA